MTWTTSVFHFSNASNGGWVILIAFIRLHRYYFVSETPYNILPPFIIINNFRHIVTKNPVGQTGSQYTFYSTKKIMKIDIWVEYVPVESSNSIFPMKTHFFGKFRSIPIFAWQYLHRSTNRPWWMCCQHNNDIGTMPILRIVCILLMFSKLYKTAPILFALMRQLWFRHDIIEILQFIFTLNN